MINDNENEAGNKWNKSHRYDIYRPRRRHRHTFTKYQMYLSMMLVVCIKQHLSKIWSSAHENLSNSEAELKSVAYKKSV